MHNGSLVRPFHRLARLALLAIVLCVLAVGLTAHRAEVAMATAPTQSGIGGSTSQATGTTALTANVPAANAPASAPANTPPASQSRSLYRAISLNGPATTIDGLAWEGADAPNVSVEGSRFCNQSVPLVPPTDAARAAMIRCSVWSWAPRVTLRDVPNGNYHVYLYVWEDNRSETFDILLNGVLVADNVTSGSAGAWRKLGPWPARSTDGRLVVEGYGGNANFSGIEIWYANVGAPPSPTSTQPSPTVPMPTATLPATRSETLYRAISLNGPATAIDGLVWEGADAPNMSIEGSRFCNQSVPLVPPTDASKTAMIRCSVWAWAPRVTLRDVPNGDYVAYLYTWEDNGSQVFDITLNDKLVADNYNSGSAGMWRKLGPWPVTVSTSAITLAAVGGNANLSGIEIWRTSGSGSVPVPTSTSAVPSPTAVVPSPTTGVPGPTAAVPSPTATVPTPPSNPQPTGEYLQAQGKNLIYKGQKVVLKGVNFDSVGAFGANIGTGNIDNIPFIEADYADLSATGANHVRFGISFTWYKKNPAAFFQKLDQQVAWARKHRIWLTFTVFTTPGDCYEGYSKSCPFWSNTAEQQELLRFWVAMANRYRSEPAVAGYDLLNEPTPPNGCSQWFPIAGTMRNAVAAVSPNQLVFVASCMGPESLELSQLPRGRNIVYEVHDYGPLDMSHDMFSLGSVYPGYADEWFGRCYYTKSTFAGVAMAGDPANCQSLVSIRERYRLNWADRNNVPIYIGEWGATSRLNGYIQYHKDKAELYRDWGVNHAAYTWKHQTIKSGGFYQWGIYSEPHRFDDPARLNAIAIAWAGAVKPSFGR